MDTSFHIRPFAFDRVFSVGAPQTGEMRVEDLQLQIAALEAEAALMRAEQDADLARARADGFEAGLDHARQEREAALLAAVDALQASIEIVDAGIDAVAGRMQADAAEVAVAAAELLAARALDTAPGAAIDAAIGRVLRQVARGQELLVRVHPDLVEEIDRLIAVRQSGDRRRLNLHVAGDAALAPGDAQIEWDQGGLILDAAARAAAVRAELETLLAP